MVNLACFWGKTGPDGVWHSAVRHMLDVGAVAAVLLDEYLPQTLTTSLSKAICGTPADSSPAKRIAFLCALHDLGKISPGFQSKVPELFPGDWPRSSNDEKDHGKSSCHSL